jgi:hypothetical protein
MVREAVESCVLDCIAARIRLAVPRPTGRLPIADQMEGPRSREQIPKILVLFE